MEAAESISGRIERVRRSARTERLRARVPRYIGIGFLAITSLVGIRQILLPAEPVPGAPPAEASADPAAENLAEQFTRAYLSYDAAHPEERERELRPFLGDELEPDGGLVAERGQQDVLWTRVAQSLPREDEGRTVVLAARTSTQMEPLYLAVGVERDGEGALRLAGYPSLVGPPSVSQGSSFEDREEVEEPKVAAMARRVVANYVAGQERNLRADLAPDAAISLPTTELRLDALDELLWAEGPGSDAVVANVRALDARRNSYALSYEIGVEQRRGRPYATYVQTVPTQ